MHHSSHSFGGEQIFSISVNTRKNDPTTNYYYYPHSHENIIQTTMNERETHTVRTIDFSRAQSIGKMLVCYARLVNARGQQTVIIVVIIIIILVSSSLVAAAVQERTIETKLRVR